MGSVIGLGLKPIGNSILMNRLSYLSRQDSRVVHEGRANIPIKILFILELILTKTF